MSTTTPLDPSAEAVETVDTAQTAQAWVRPHPEDLAALVVDLWSAFVGDAEALELGATPPQGTSPSWSAAVSTSGAARALAVVELDHRAAVEVTRAMLGLGGGPHGEPPEPDLRDAVGELANVVGGNLKSLLPGPSTLSLPLVAAGELSTPAGLQVLCDLTCRWRGTHVRFALHHDPDHPTSPPESTP